MKINSANYVVMETSSMGNNIFEQLVSSPEHICNDFVMHTLKMPVYLDLVLQVVVHVEVLR